MNSYLSGLKKIESNFENYGNVELLQQQLFALFLCIENDTKHITIEPLKASDVTKNVVSKLFNPSTKNSIIKTLFTQLDNQIIGFQKGELIVIGARPGMGKSQFLIQLSTNIAKQQKAVTFFSLKKSAELITQKLLANIGELNPDFFIKPTAANQGKKLSEAIKLLQKLPIYLYDNPSPQLSVLISLIRKTKISNNVDVVFIDDLQLIKVGNKFLNRELEISLISSELKKIAVELGIILITSSSLNSESENCIEGSMRPKLADLIGIDTIEQHADKILFLYRPEYYGIEVDENHQPTKNLMELLLTQNRNGVLCDVNVKIQFHKSIIIN